MKFGRFYIFIDFFFVTIEHIILSNNKKYNQKYRIARHTVIDGSLISIQTSVSWWFTKASLTRAFTLTELQYKYKINHVSWFFDTNKTRFEGQKSVW